MNTTPARESTVMQKSVDTLDGVWLNPKPSLKLLQPKQPAAAKRGPKSFAMTFPEITGPESIGVLSDPWPTQPYWRLKWITRMCVILGAISIAVLLMAAPTRLHGEAHHTVLATHGGAGQRRGRQNG